MPKSAAEKSQDFREEVSAAMGEYLRETAPSKHSIDDFVAFLLQRET